MPRKTSKPAKRVPFVPHPQKVALDKWEADHPGIFDAETLGSVSPTTYLTNRLHRAFQEGWDAAMNHIKEVQRAN